MNRHVNVRANSLVTYKKKLHTRNRRIIFWSAVQLCSQLLAVADIRSFYTQRAIWFWFPPISKHWEPQTKEVLFDVENRNNNAYIVQPLQLL